MSDRGCPTESVEITGDTAPGKKKREIIFCCFVSTVSSALPSFFSSS